MHLLQAVQRCGIEYHAWQTFVINPLPAVGFIEPFRRKLKKLNAGYTHLGRYDLFLYSDRHTLDEYEMEPLLEMLCEENQAPISYRYVYIDADGKLACFDLVQRTYEARPTGGIREKLLGETAE